MTEECIHGLQLDRCDLCSPKARPAPVAPVPRTRVRSSSTSSSGSLSKSASASSRPAAVRSQSKPVILSEQRIHHFTHIDNLTGILADGMLHADAAQSWSERPEIDISSRDTREARRSTPVAGTESFVADYVPFFLSPNSNLWEGMRARTPDPRLTKAARTVPAAEFVMLVTTIKQIATVGTQYPVVTDGDAADPRTRFATTQDDSERVLRRMLASDDGSVLRAELLVFDSVPFEVITLVGVANDKARAAARSLLTGSGFQPRVAVHPPWFALPAVA